MAKYYFTIRTEAKVWDQLPQQSVTFTRREQFAQFCRKLAEAFNTEVRGCESKGYNNQGHYFNNR